MPARIHQVEMASSIEGQVTEGRQLRVQHFINLHYQTCTFRVYQEIFNSSDKAQQYLPEDSSRVLKHLFHQPSSSYLSTPHE